MTVLTDGLMAAAGNQAASGGFYYLNVDFALFTPQPTQLGDGRLLDTADEGVTAGHLTVVETLNGNLFAENNMLSMDGDGAWERTGLHYNGGIPRAAGVVYAVKGVKLPATGQDLFIALHETQNSISTAPVINFFINASQCYVNGVVVATSSSVFYDYAIELTPTQNRFYRKLSTSSVWTLLTTTSGTSTPLYPIITVYTNGVGLNVTSIEASKDLYTF